MLEAALDISMTMKPTRSETLPQKTKALGLMM